MINCSSIILAVLCVAAVRRCYCWRICSPMIRWQHIEWLAGLAYYAGPSMGPRL